MRNRVIQRPGFTLVEIMLALAVASLGVVAILGLLPNAIQSGRDAADNTISATIVHDVFSTIRDSPFTSITNAFGLTVGGSPLPNPCNLQTYSLPPPPLGAQGAVAYFDRSGFTTNLAGGYYKVTLYFKPETVPLAAVSTVTATVVWPAQSAAPLSTIVFVTKVAQYTQ